jgi:hypothetical protein
MKGMMGLRKLEMLDGHLKSKTNKKATYRRKSQKIQDSAGVCTFANSVVYSYTKPEAYFHCI